MRISGNGSSIRPADRGRAGVLWAGYSEEAGCGGDHTFQLAVVMVLFIFSKNVVFADIDYHQK